jgi:hypothetical protein
VCNPSCQPTPADRALPVRASLWTAFAMNDDSPVTPEQADAEDNDPWTSFGSYSDADIAVVRPLLQQAAIKFYVGPDTFADDPASLTPNHLWVHDEDVAYAQSILVPYFQARTNT